MRAAVGLTDGLGLDGDRCIRVIPRQRVIRNEQQNFSFAIQTLFMIFRLKFDSVLDQKNSAFTKL